MEATLGELKDSITKSGQAMAGVGVRGAAGGSLRRWNTAIFGALAMAKGKAPADESQEMSDVSAMATSASTFGAQATIVASTIFFNIVTYETNVLNPYIGWGLPDTGRGKGVTQWTTSYLVAALSSFVFGLSCLFLSTLFEAHLRALTTNRPRISWSNTSTRVASVSPSVPSVHRRTTRASGT